MGTRERVREFIVTNFYVPDPQRLGDEVPLLATGIVDSTGMLEVIEFVETEFGIEIGEREVLPENLGTIGRIVDYLDRKLAAGAGTGAAA